MLDFFSHFAIQMVAAFAALGLLYLISKIRKPKAGESSEQELIDTLAIATVSVSSPFIVWSIPAFASLFAMYIFQAYDFWPVASVFWVITLFYLCWIIGYSFGSIFKRNFPSARIAYGKDPKTYNERILNDPRVLKRLALYPESLRKLFINLAGKKWL